MAASHFLLLLIKRFFIHIKFILLFVYIYSLYFLCIFSSRHAVRKGRRKPVSAIKA